MKIRIKFSKYGPLRFIGHLDIMRFFQKVIRRAGIDVTYSAGFSPHQVMTFAAPLGVGLCSLGEYMDIEVNSQQGAEDMKRRLQNACPYGIDILSVKALQKTAGNAMASVAAASYAAVFRDRSRSFDDYTGQCAAFLAREEILIQKETKRGTAEVNIRPGIYSLGIEDGALVFTVDASSAGNSRPSVVTEQFLRFAGASEQENAFQIVRLEIYTRSGEEAGLIPLDEVGEAF